MRTRTTLIDVYTTGSSDSDKNRVCLCSRANQNRKTPIAPNHVIKWYINSCFLKKRNWIRFSIVQNHLWKWHRRIAFMSVGSIRTPQRKLYSESNNASVIFASSLTNTHAYSLRKVAVYLVRRETYVYVFSYRWNDLARFLRFKSSWFMGNCLYVYVRVCVCLCWTSSIKYAKSACFSVLSRIE